MNTRFGLVYGTALAVMLALDAVWLGLVARGMYARELGHLLAPQVRWVAALAFYLLYTIGLLALVVLPDRQAPLQRVVWRAALFGLVAYATYDLTNLATIAGWPLRVTVVDLAWGAFITAASGAAAHLVARRLPR